MNQQKCSNCNTEFVARDGSVACPSCGSIEDNRPSRSDISKSLDVTIDRSITVDDTDNWSKEVSQLVSNMQVSEESVVPSDGGDRRLSLIHISEPTRPY